jgi:hypothetical protein
MESLTIFQVYMYYNYLLIMMNNLDEKVHKLREKRKMKQAASKLRNNDLENEIDDEGK